MDLTDEVLGIGKRWGSFVHEVWMREIAEAGPGGSPYRVPLRQRRTGGRIKPDSSLIGLLAISVLFLAACQATGEQACVGQGYGINSPEFYDCAAAQSESWAQGALDEAQSGFERRSPWDRGHSFGGR